MLISIDSPVAIYSQGRRKQCMVAKSLGNLAGLMYQTEENLLIFEERFAKTRFYGFVGFTLLHLQRRWESEYFSGSKHWRRMSLVVVLLMTALRTGWR